MNQCCDYNHTSAIQAYITFNFISLIVESYLSVLQFNHKDSRWKKLHNYLVLDTMTTKGHFFDYMLDIEKIYQEIGIDRIRLSS